VVQGTRPCSSMPAARDSAGGVPHAYFNVRTPQSVNTFLVDGAVAGTWRHEKGRVRLQPFRRLDRGTRRQLEEEGERLAQLHT
jgi:Winged helix DNA-binding domain